MANETGDREKSTSSLISTWQYIRDGAIVFMGLFSIAIQTALILKVDRMILNYAGIWFGIPAVLSGLCGIIANRKKTVVLGVIWAILAFITMGIAVGPMYFSAFEWQEASNDPNFGSSYQLNVIAAWCGVLFFCGFLSAIFSLFAACSAFLLVSENIHTSKTGRVIMLHNPGNQAESQY